MATHSALVGRIANTFLAPSRLAGELRQNTPWLDVLLISTVVALLSVAFVPDDVFTASMQDAVSRRGEPVEITSSPETIAFWGRTMGMLGIIATHPLVAVTLAGVLTLLYSIVGRGPAGFLEFLSLVSHAMLIPALGTILSIALRLTTGDAVLGAVSTYTANPSNLLSATLFSLDPFIVWMLVALAFGIRGLGASRSVPRGALVLVGGYVVFVLATTAILHPELRGAAGLALRMF